MNIKNISLSMLAIAVIGLFSFTLPKNGNPEKLTYVVDVEKSSLQWLGKKVTGQHNGYIQLDEGTLIVSGNELKGGTFTIDMTSITNVDIEDQEYNKKLVGHLKSDDFFGVQEYPVSTFEITDVKPKAGNKYEVTGNLTIKDITNEITFPAEIEIEAGKITAEAEITVDRSKYNVRYGSGSFFDNLGDKTIYDDFELSLFLVAHK